MTAEEFFSRWQASFPGALPIIRYFPHDFDHRWLRIPSLPNGKTYADTTEEKEMLFNRQNQIITDLIGNDSRFLLVTGEFYMEGSRELNTVNQVESLSSLSFTPLNPIDMHQFKADEYDSGHEFRPMFIEQTWHPQAFDELLWEIYNDVIWAFFLSMDHRTLVSPGTGGTDCLLPDAAAKEHMREKYDTWL